MHVEAPSTSRTRGDNSASMAFTRLHKQPKPSNLPKNSLLRNPPPCRGLREATPPQVLLG